MNLAFWRKHSCPEEGREAVQEALLRAQKNTYLIKKEGELVASEQHNADRFRERRESNGFLEMIEEIFVEEKK